MTNVQIGQIFNGLTFSSVAKVYYRMSKAIREKRALRKKVEKIISALSLFKGWFFGLHTNI